jgi:hypothetical protein
MTTIEAMLRTGVHRGSYADTCRGSEAGVRRGSGAGTSRDRCVGFGGRCGRRCAVPSSSRCVPQVRPCRPPCEEPRRRACAKRHRGACGPLGANGDGGAGAPRADGSGTGASTPDVPAPALSRRVSTRTPSDGRSRGRRWAAGLRRRVASSRRGLHDAGMATAEYAIVTIAAVGFAGLLVAVLRSDEVRALLLGLVRGALTR